MFDLTEEDVIEFIKDKFQTTLQCERINISEVIDIYKTNASKLVFYFTSSLLVL